MKDLTGRMVRYGLGNVSPNQQTKSSDLIGITTVTITLDMVGQTIGVFTAIEVKKEDWNIEKKLDKHETFQLNFLNWVKLRGGLGGFCNSVDEIQKLITR